MKLLKKIGEITETTIRMPHTTTLLPISMGIAMSVLVVLVLAAVVVDGSFLIQEAEARPKGMAKDYIG
jgi:hypothetical protein